MTGAAASRLRDSFGLTLVTGATGFVGSYTAERLASGGVEVRGTVRGGATVTDPRVEAAHVRDILDVNSIRRAVQAVRTIVHCAGLAHRPANESGLAAFRAVNVEGTRLLIEEAIAAGVETFVLISSVGAVCTTSASRVSEQTIPRPTSPYGQSRLEAELLVQSMARASGVRAPILRLPMVYGPGMRGNPRRLISLLHRGIPVPVGRVDNLRSVAYVGNVFAAVTALVRSPTRTDAPFFVRDATELSTRDFAAVMARSLGRRARVVRLPQVMFRMAGRAGDVLGSDFGLPVDSATIEGLVGSLLIDSSLLERQTGFRPPFTLEDGMAETASWYVAAAKRKP